jgi:predicted DNA-binding transcriptional regulator AlpA
MAVENISELLSPDHGASGVGVNLRLQSENRRKIIAAILHI